MAEGKLDVTAPGGVYQKGDLLVNAAGEVVGKAEDKKPRVKVAPAPPPASEVKPVEAPKAKKAKDD